MASSGSPNSDSRLENRLFVNKIAPEIKEEQIRDYFVGLGSVIDFYMPKDNNSD